MNKLSVVFILGMVVCSCSRQFAVTVNNQSVYDPRIPAATLQVTDTDLQGCINLAIRQQRLENPAELTVLSCANANVRQLDGIAQFPGLRFLDLANNRITNLEPLSRMNQLSGLSISDNPVSDIGALFTLTGLTAAILTGNNSIPCSQLDQLQVRLGENLTRPQNCAN